MKKIILPFTIVLSMLNVVAQDSFHRKPGLTAGTVDNALNDKIVLTSDIDHFWEAFDDLEKCKTRQDSIHTFQTLYLDRGTDGLKDFTKARDFTAEKFVNAVADFPNFYNSVRNNTYEVKKAVPAINDIVERFEKLYKNFNPSKICFAIGIANTGGTVSDNFLLIGAEISTATKTTNVSDFANKAFADVVATGDDIAQKIKNIVAHEYVHTQQKQPLNEEAIECRLLYQSLREGPCDFIGELITGSGNQINSVAHNFGNKNEKQIWEDFKKELCNTSLSNWFYNHHNVKDKPADLGYYVGYKIAEEYYKNAADKQQAIIDIIEMDDPIIFLQKSKYDQKNKH